MLRAQRDQPKTHVAEDSDVHTTIELLTARETSESLYDEQFDINIKGAYFTIQRALPLLNDGASIILNTSVADRKGSEGTSAYSATKAALRSLARTAAAELVGRGIRVNTVAPRP